MIRRFLYCLLISFITVSLNYSKAQTIIQPIITNFIPPSPEAQSFMRYGEIPVDASTGVPDIEIPIYEINTGKLKLPIALTYHSAGIRVNDIASVVGLGWRLSAGGVLTKTVVGQPDNHLDYGMFNYPYLTKSQIDALPQDGSEFLHLKMISEGTMDGESDRYYYSAGDKLSGEFVYDHSMNIVQATYSDNKIVGLNPSSDGGPTSYKVTSEDGTQYYFETPEYSAIGIDPQYVSSWWLTRIVSADNADVISFEYQTDNTNAVTFVPNQSVTYTGQGSSFSLLGHEIYSKAVLLKKITFKNGYVSFDYANDRKDLQYNRLTAISIYDTKSSTTIRSYQLFHSYFNSGMADNKYNYRLKLDKVSTFDGTMKNMGDYTFNYNQDHDMPPYIQDNLTNPPDCYGQDYYGYFNGVTTNTHLIPGPLYSPDVGANRDADSNYVKTCILTQINYPTGGSTHFEYDLNESTSGAITQGAGLRVRRITSKSGPNNVATVKRYEYANNLLKADLDLDVAGVTSYEWHPFVFYNTTCLDVTGDYVTFLANGVLPFANFHGSPVIYQNVDEYDEDPASDVDLKKSYLYGADNDPIINVTSTRYMNQYFVDCPWKKGQLLGVNYYKFNANTHTYKLIKEVSNTYTDYRDTTLIIGTKIERINPLIQSGCAADQFASGSTYQQYFTYFDIPVEVGARKLTKVQTSEFDDSGNSITSTQTTAYTSAYHLFPTEQTNVTSTGDIRKVDYTYPFDYSGTPVYDQMISRNIVSPVIEKKIYNQGNTFLEGLRTNYQFWNGTAWSSTATNFIVPKLVETQHATAAYEPRIQYLTYDANNSNVTTVAKANGPNTSYQWGYNGQFPVAQVANASSNDIFYESFEEGNGNGRYNDSKTGHYSYNGSATAYSKSLTGLSGGNYVLSYWLKSDNGWILKTSLLTVTGGTYTISQNNQIQTGQVDDIRFYPAGSQMTTYTYDPLVGRTSMTDARNESTYYEYDAFQRLVNVKDHNGHIKTHYCYNYAGQQTDCSVLPGVYARVEIGPIQTSTSGDYQNSTTTGYADVYIKFYSDANCTNPLVLAYPVDVSVVMTEEINDDTGISDYPTTYTYHVPSGQSSYVLGSNLMMYNDQSYYDSDGIYHASDYSWDYEVQDIGGWYVPEMTIYN